MVPDGGVTPQAFGNRFKSRLSQYKNQQT